MEKNDTISILYVEDQDDVRLFLSKILSRHYSKVLLAENGKKGLELYKQHRPDIIISDIKMPVMDGLSMSSRIKEIDPEAKIILTTAHSDMEYFIQSIDIGISQYILKPIDREKLYGAIDACKEQVMMKRRIENQNNKLRQKNDTLSKQERELRENLQKTIALKEIIGRSEENFRKVAENIQDAFWLRDENKVLFVNNAFENLFEISSSAMYENPDCFKDYILDEDRDSFFAQLGQHEDRKKGNLNTEFKIITDSGKTKNIWYRDVYIQADNPKESRRICTLSDISWKIENEKLHHELMLAEESARIKHRLLANVSHELRTPLNAIFAMSDILVTTSLSVTQDEYVKVIMQAGEDLLEITNNLLDINELEQNQVQLTLRNIESNKLFQPIISKFSEIASEKGLNFRTNFTPEFPEVFISDPKRIRQIIENILANAIKFTNKGEISINFDSQKTGEKQSKLMIVITDTGIGIKEPNLEKIFQLFTQQEDGDSRSFGGLGLGLGICARLSKLLGGDISVTSTENKGSTFRIIIPVETVSSNGFTTKQTKQVLPQLNLKVLYAEDKEVNQKIISIMLQNAGCTVDIACNGEKALELYNKKKYDVILMDIQMPVMDGITATKELRKRHKELPPIIGISANALKADAQYYIAQGLDDYISKPVVPAILYSKIQEWVSQNKIENKSLQEFTKYDKEFTIPEYEELVDIDLQTLESLKEQTDNDEAIISDLYQTFIMEADALIEKIKNALDEKDTPTLKEATHAFKGLSATIGAIKINHVSSDMDRLHKKEIYNKSAGFFRLLERDYLKAKSFIVEKIIKQ